MQPQTYLPLGPVSDTPHPSGRNSLTIRLRLRRVGSGVSNLVGACRSLGQQSPGTVHQDPHGAGNAAARGDLPAGAYWRVGCNGRCRVRV